MGRYDGALSHRVFGGSIATDAQSASSGSSSSGSAFSDQALADRGCLETAKRLLAQRQARFSYFTNSSLFVEPAWDILLHMFVSKAEARPASLGDLSIAANCAQSTALRWLNVLAEEGLVSLHDYSEHLPELRVALSVKGHAVMVRYLCDVSTD